MDRLKRLWDTQWGPIIIGFVLVFTGWLMQVFQLPVLHFIQATFLLMFLGYAMSTTGLLLGIIGAARIVAKNRGAAQKEAERKRYPWER